jgi:single-strand selective monofunctional uracil DNA glycosylase
MNFTRRLRQFSSDLNALSFPRAAWVYNPYYYAEAAVLEYWERFAKGRKEIVFLGMNPGPWGMLQTGIPFGEISAVRDWMKITAPIEQPDRAHPSRPVLGLGCNRSEVSGRRLWGWIRKAYPEPEEFFRHRVVHNFCPLAFLEETGRNLTPDKLPSSEQAPLESLCQEFLEDLLREWRPEWLIGVGQFAADRLLKTGFPGDKVVRIAHPSPANPKANKDWEGTVKAEIAASGCPPIA